MNRDKSGQIDDNNNREKDVRMLQKLRCCVMKHKVEEKRQDEHQLYAPKPLRKTVDYSLLRMMSMYE